MNPKLRNLLIAIGIIAIGGVPFFLVTPKPGVVRAELADAGITADCDPVVVTCAGRDLCQNTLADGGLSKRYRTIRTLAYRCDRPGNPVPVLIIRTANPECFEPIGPPDDACQVLGTTFDDGGLSAQVEPDRCACRDRSSMCRTPNPDGGVGIPMTFAMTYAAPFAGVGCVRKVCSEAAGEQNQSMPTECQ